MPIRWEVLLLSGHIGGHLVRTGGKIRNKNGTALKADRLRVDQSLLCH
jgi:hypothetical protein